MTRELVLPAARLLPVLAELALLAAQAAGVAAAVVAPLADLIQHLPGPAGLQAEHQRQDGAAHQGHGVHLHSQGGILLLCFIT